MSGYTNIDINTGGDYIELKAGEVVTFHILSESPTKEMIHWIDRKKNKCIGSDCDFCANGSPVKQRWTCDVWDRKDKKVKKFEFGPMIASQIKSIAEMLAENQQTIKDVDIRVKTTGSSLETEYSVLHVPVSGEIPADISEKYSVPF